MIEKFIKTKNKKLIEGLKRKFCIFIQTKNIFNQKKHLDKILKEGNTMRLITIISQNREPGCNQLLRKRCGVTFHVLVDEKVMTQLMQYSISLRLF